MVQQDALQAAIWRVEYGNSFQLDGVDNSTPASDPFNAMIASTYQADLAALGNNTAPVGSVLWISPGSSVNTTQGQGVVATTLTASGSTMQQQQTATPPQVTNIVVSGQSKKGLSSFAVAFNEPLTGGSATNGSLYHVFRAVKKVVKRHKVTVFTKSLPIHPVSLNGSGNTVTINLAKPFKGTVEVMVQGTVTATNGASNSVSSMKVL